MSAIVFTSFGPFAPARMNAPSSCSILMRSWIFHATNPRAKLSRERALIARKRFRLLDDDVGKPRISADRARVVKRAAMQMMRIAAEHFTRSLPRGR